MLRKNGDWVELSPTKLQSLISREGEIKFIFEGVDASLNSCSEGSAEECYVEVELYNAVPSSSSRREPPAIAKVLLILDLNDVKAFYDHYTAGSAQSLQFGTDFSAVEPDAITPERLRQPNLDLLEGVALGNVISDDYILMVHGWRMRDEEKLQFAETAFKRLYWAGYQGRFGFLSWPTGWFNKPAHEYDTSLLTLAANTQNYDESEVVARQTGRLLASYIDTIRGESASMHVLAHSMGNVVVSEMLRNPLAGGIQSYAASQTADAAGAYDRNQQPTNHLLTEIVVAGALGVEPYPQTCQDNFEAGNAIPRDIAWRCYNALGSNVDEILGAYDMPPDRYQYPKTPLNFDPASSNSDQLEKYVPTVGDKYVPYTQDGSPYYFGDGGNSFGGVNIVNFYNEQDAALTAWEFNQLTKPDYRDVLAGDPGWVYSNETRAILDDWLELPSLIAFAESQNNTTRYNQLVALQSELAPVVEEIQNGEWHKDNVFTTYYARTRLILTDVELEWSMNANDEDTFFTNAQILAHITPARTEPMGQVRGSDASLLGQPIELESAREGDNREFRDSNQGHSAQFYSHFAIQKTYWQQVLSRSVELEGSKYSGLREQ